MAIGESEKEVRTTWIGFAVIFGVVAGLLWYKERGTWPWLAGTSLFFALFAATAPMALLPLYRLWVKLAGFLAWFNTRLLLGLVYFAVLTPMGLLMRAAGKDPMKRRLDPDAASYWVPRDGAFDRARLTKQY